MLEFMRFCCEWVKTIQKMSQQDESSESLDSHIKRIHPFGILDPYTHPSWTILGCIKYILWFPIEFPLTLFMCIVGFFLAGYAWIKLKRNTKITPKQITKTTDKNTNKDIISIIISCFNEIHNVELCLLYLEKYCTNPSKCEIILIDGGSTDGWIEKLQNGILNNKNKIITIPTKILPYSSHECSGRGICQNIGVKNANGNILLFIHADTILFQGYDKHIRNKLTQENIVIGSFKFTVNRSLLNYPLVGIGCMELFARIRNNCFWLPYGDQGYFIKKDVFTKILNGFENNLIIMEDLVLTSKARRLAVETGNIIYIDDNNAFCSPRRWQKNGVTKNTMWNQIIVFCYSYLKYTPAQCYKLYYGVDVPVNKNKNITFD
eukprot:345625_1